jgi:trans-aconitate methyltransferase
MTRWDRYYASRLTLPRESYTWPFLRHLPQNARVLDFGSGNGNWAAAFHRDRPDLTIDLIDTNAPSPSLIPPDWQGEVTQSDFTAFLPTREYEGIWANNSLFFLARQEIAPTFHKLAEALTPQGLVQFTMLQEGNAVPGSLSGLSRQAILRMLETEHLSPIFIKHVENVTYGGYAQRKIPTFYVQAQKPRPG